MVLALIEIAALLLIGAVAGVYVLWNLPAPWIHRVAIVGQRRARAGLGGWGWVIAIVAGIVYMYGMRGH